MCVCVCVCVCVFVCVCVCTVSKVADIISIILLSKDQVIDGILIYETCLFFFSIFKVLKFFICKFFHS